VACIKNWQQKPDLSPNSNEDIEMYEFEIEFSVLSQDGYIEVSYSIDPDDGGIGITEVIWKQRHKTDRQQWHLTESIRRYNEWTYLDITAMLTTESAQEIIHEAEKHHERFHCDYDIKEKKQSPVFAGYDSYPGKPL